MRSHLTYTHQCWEKWVRPGDTVVDATIGNGQDTVFLARLLQGEGQLVGYDIQAQALEETKKRLGPLPENLRGVVTLKQLSHVHFSELDVKLFVYNLGYLPGSDKTITTQTESTLLSLQNALPRLASEGAISITCYPGHAEGAREQEALLSYLQQLPSSQWLITHQIWLNRPHYPSWIWLQAAPRA